jgi:hypothetical protein
VKVIETEWNGYKFRSRLEARWAVFFDNVGIEYRYEPEGFDIDGIWYLPDFYLPKHNCWVEIKPSDPSQEEMAKAAALGYSQGPAYIFHGEVWLNGYDTLQFTNDPVESPRSHMKWALCVYCDALGLFDGGLWYHNWPCNCLRSRVTTDSAETRYLGHGGIHDAPRLLAAYTVARQMCF